MRCRKIGSEREVYSNAGLPQEAKKISNKQPVFTPKEIEKEIKSKPIFSRRKEIIKNQNINKYNRDQWK